MINTNSTAIETIILFATYLTNYVNPYEIMERLHGFKSRFFVTLSNLAV